jgi:hypothetical protein
MALWGSRVYPYNAVRTVAEGAGSAAGGVHFTVGSLQYTDRRAGGIDFREEIELVKAALLLASTAAASRMDHMVKIMRHLTNIQIPSQHPYLAHI